MKIVWNLAKASSNKLKHRVSFSDVEEVFSDYHAISIEDPDADDENRYITIGLDALGRIVVVVYTYQDSVIRIISARKAMPAETAFYESHLSP